MTDGICGVKKKKFCVIFIRLIVVKRSSQGRRLPWSAGNRGRESVTKVKSLKDGVAIDAMNTPGHAAAGELESSKRFFHSPVVRSFLDLRVSWLVFGLARDAASCHGGKIRRHFSADAPVRAEPTPSALCSNPPKPAPRAQNAEQEFPETIPIPRNPESSI